MVQRPRGELEEQEPSLQRRRDVPVSPARFARLKEQLLPQLRARADAPPRQLRPGTGTRATLWTNLARLLQTGNGGALVRGFCLYELPNQASRRRTPAWRCLFHAVVETRTPSGHLVYADPTESRRVGDEGAPYIFVPSSRAHAQLSDAQLLSGEWLTGSVLLGEPLFCNAVLAHEESRGRRASVVALTPEALVAKRDARVRALPHFGEWMRLRQIGEHPDTLGELMGMQVHDAGAGEADESDAVAAYQAVARNPESYVAGLEGFKLELECREKLFAGTISLDQVRTRFFGYYDDTYHSMREAQLEAVGQRLAELGL